MSIPTSEDFQNAKIDVDDLADIVNGSETVTTRLGGDKLSVDQALSQIIVGEITAYSPLSVYSDIEDWVEFSGAVYRPLPSQLPIGPEAFDASKWAAAQGFAAADNIQLTNNGLLRSSLQSYLENKEVTDYAELRGLPADQLSNNDHFSVRYRDSKGDGGGGVFYWDNSDNSSSVASDAQSGLYIAPNFDSSGSSGCFIRSEKQPLNARWFGAKGDGVSNDYLPILGTINSAKMTNGAVYFPQASSRYLCNGDPIDLGSSFISIFGDDRATQIRKTDDSSLFVLSASSRVTIRDIRLRGSDSTTVTNSATTHCLDVQANCQFLMLENVWIGDWGGNGINCKAGYNLKIGPITEFSNCLNNIYISGNSSPAQVAANIQLDTVTSLNAREWNMLAERESTFGAFQIEILNTFMKDGVLGNARIDGSVHVTAKDWLLEHDTLSVNSLELNEVQHFDIHVNANRGITVANCAYGIIKGKVSSGYSITESGNKTVSFPVEATITGAPPALDVDRNIRLRGQTNPYDSTTWNGSDYGKTLVTSEYDGGTAPPYTTFALGFSGFERGGAPTDRSGRYVIGVADGGDAVEIARFDNDSTTGNTRFLIYDTDSGSIQRVKVGGNNSGPSGSGRALYIDNS